MSSHSPNDHLEGAWNPSNRQSNNNLLVAKRKSTDGVDSDLSHHETDHSKKRKRKVSHACIYCRRSHMTCDLGRPCARCVKREIGHLCHDEQSAYRKNRTEAGRAPDTGNGVEDVADGGVYVVPPQLPPQDNAGMVMRPTRRATGDGAVAEGNVPHLVQQTSMSPTEPKRDAPPAAGSTAQQNFEWTNYGIQNQFQDMHHLHPNYMFNNSEVTNEYNLLNDFLSNSLLDDGAMYTNDDAKVMLSDPLLSASSMNALRSQPRQDLQPLQTLQQTSPQQLIPTAPSKAGAEISRPSSAFPTSEQSRNTFYMTAADPAGLSSAEDRLHKLLKAKYDAGMLKPFNYVRGYARLNTYMSKHLSRTSQVRILQQLDRFRPSFREAMQGLSDVQLVLVEMWFERSLMEYDRVFASMAVPACCWRRTGEIFRGNREMAELIGVGWEKLRDGTLAIHEIIVEDSLVSYWEKFGAVAFDQSQKAILTSCSLKKIDSPAGKAGDPAAIAEAIRSDRLDTVRCCFSFTIRRDTHNIPSLIVGNFIPIRK